MSPAGEGRCACGAVDARYADRTEASALAAALGDDPWDAVVDA